MVTYVSNNILSNKLFYASNFIFISIINEYDWVKNIMIHLILVINSQAFHPISLLHHTRLTFPKYRV